MSVIRTHWRRGQEHRSLVCTAAQRRDKCSYVARFFVWGGGLGRLARSIAKSKASLGAVQDAHLDLEVAWCELPVAVLRWKGTVDAGLLFFRCGSKRGVPHALRWPCSRRPAHITRARVLLALHGWTKLEIRRLQQARYYIARKRSRQGGSPLVAWQS